MIVIVKIEGKQNKTEKKEKIYKIGISFKPTKNAVMLSYITQFNCANGEAMAHFKLGSVCLDIYWIIITLWDDDDNWINGKLVRSPFLRDDYHHDKWKWFSFTQLIF